MRPLPAQVALLRPFTGTHAFPAQRWRPIRARAHLSAHTPGQAEPPSAQVLGRIGLRGAQGAAWRQESARARARRGPGPSPWGGDGLRHQEVGPRIAPTTPSTCTSTAKERPAARCRALVHVRKAVRPCPSRSALPHFPHLPGTLMTSATVWGYLLRCYLPAYEAPGSVHHGDDARYGRSGG
jgi:hypothetical protein